MALQTSPGSAVASVASTSLEVGVKLPRQVLLTCKHNPSKPLRLSASKLDPGRLSISRSDVALADLPVQRLPRRNSTSRYDSQEAGNPEVSVERAPTCTTLQDWLDRDASWAFAPGLEDSWTSSAEEPDLEEETYDVSRGNEARHPFFSHFLPDVQQPQAADRALHPELEAAEVRLRPLHSLRSTEDAALGPVEAAGGHTFRVQGLTDDEGYFAMPPAERRQGGAEERPGERGELFWRGRAEYSRGEACPDLLRERATLEGNRSRDASQLEAPFGDATRSPKHPRRLDFERTRVEGPGKSDLWGDPGVPTETQGNTGPDQPETSPLKRGLTPRQLDAETGTGVPLVRPAPTIFPVSDTALRSLIPLSGSGTQVLQHLGGPLDWFRRFILSMSGAVLLYNLSPLCTIVAAFYWAWAPIWSAALSNMALRRKYPHAGFWIGRVLCARAEKGRDGRKKWRLVVGDTAGVRVEIVSDAPNMTSRLARGEPVQMVAVSDTASFSRFRVLREAFLPRRGVWLAEQAAVERPVFECLQVHVVPAVLNKLPAEDDKDWESLFSIMCDETTETVRQYSFEDDLLVQNGTDLESSPLSIFDSNGDGIPCGCPELVEDIGLHAMLSDGQEAEIRDQYRELS